jgi:hypothetical protein
MARSAAFVISSSASPLGTHEPGAHDGWPYEKTPSKLANRNAMKSDVLTIHSLYEITLVLSYDLV